MDGVGFPQHQVWDFDEHNYSENPEVAYNNMKAL